MQVSFDDVVSIECEPGWWAEGEVLDPQNLALPAEVTRTQNLGVASARVRFTAATPGSYLVSMRFEPTLARLQRIVQVARDRLSEPPIVDAFPFDPAQCAPVFRTLRGSMLCQRGSTAVVVRGGAVLESFADTRANVVGDTVWLLTTRGLERRTDTGAGPLVLTGSLPAMVGFASDSSFFEDDRAIVLDGSTVRGPFVWDGTRLVDGQHRFRVGSGFLLGDLALSFDGSSVCDGEVTDGGGCTTITPVGVQGHVVWTFEGQDLVYRAGPFTAPASRFPIGSANVDPIVFPINGSHTPHLQTSSVGVRRFTVTLTAAGPLLDEWPVGAAFTRDFALVGSTSNTAKWIRR